MANFLNTKQYEIFRAKMQIALTSKQYDADPEKRARVVKYYRQCMYNITRNRPLPAYPS